MHIHGSCNTHTRTYIRTLSQADARAYIIQSVLVTPVNNIAYSFYICDHMRCSKFVIKFTIFWIT